MEYQVPQFIEVESKVVGPLTLKQFIYIAGAIGLCVVFFTYFSFLFAILFSIPVAGLAVALAFYKVNGKSFVEVLEAGFNYYTGAKLFLWKKEAPKEERRNAPVAETAISERRGTPKLTRGKLSDLAWSLDVKTGTETPSPRNKPS